MCVLVFQLFLLSLGCVDEFLVVGALFHHPDSLQYPAQFTLRMT